MRVLGQGFFVSVEVLTYSPNNRNLGMRQKRQPLYATPIQTIYRRDYN